MDMLTLICWVRSGINDTSTFPVKISKSELVHDLQTAIKNIAFPEVTVAARNLPLYKPKNPVPKPYEENLNKFILLHHAERLDGPDGLSKVFSAPPPSDMIHVIVCT